MKKETGVFQKELEQRILKFKRVKTDPKNKFLKKLKKL